MEEVLRQFLPPDKSGTSLAIYAVNRPVWPSEREEAAARHIPAHIWLFGQRIGDEVKLQGFLLVGSPKGFMVGG